MNYESDSQSQRVRPLVCAVTANWNGVEDTLELIESLRRQTYDRLEIVVVDNASDGDDVARIEKRYGDSISIVRNENNLGCAGGYNSGIGYALERFAPQYILAVNNDVVCDVDMVSELVRTATEMHAGVVGPKIYYYDWNGRSDVIWSAGGLVHRWGLKIHSQRGDGADDGPAFDVMREVDWTSGAAVLLETAALSDAGYFNTWYFVGHEDIELCLKAAAAGYRIVYTPSARAWHKVGASAKKVGISYADPAAYYYLIRHTFPTHVYLYHLALFPLLLARWGALFLLRSRDRNQLRRFARDMRRLLTGGRATSRAGR